MDLKAFDGLIAEDSSRQLRTFDQRDAFGRQALKFDRSYFRSRSARAGSCAGACSLSSSWRPIAVSRTMEQVDGRPEQILEVRLEPGVAQGGNQGVEDIGDCASRSSCLRAAVWDQAGRRMDGSQRAAVRRGRARSEMTPCAGSMSSWSVMR